LEADETQRALVGQHLRDDLRRWSNGSTPIAQLRYERAVRAFDNKDYQVIPSQCLPDEFLDKVFGE